MDTIDFIFRGDNSSGFQSREEEMRCIKKAKKGDRKARNKILEKHKKFVFKFIQQWNNDNVDIKDLFQEALLGLIEAIEKVEPQRDVKFLSYARYHVKRKALDFLTQTNDLIRLPQNKKTLLLEIRKTRDRLKQQNLEEPNLSEIAEEMNRDIEDLEFVIRTSQTPRFLEDKIGSDSNPLRLKEVLSAPERKESENISNERFRKFIRKHLSKLSQREAEILEKYFGINCKSQNLKQIANSKGLTRERIRQIKQKAIRRLRDFNDEELRMFL
ncbi:MAG: sigma-70 family RNA polymerase sigma factor [Candidatus Magasanikbacteria bacterium]